MSKKSESRKEFLKRFGFGMFPQKSDTSESEDYEVVTLSEEQLSFLKEYESWLNDFHAFLKKKHADPFNSENNKKLMELSADAEKRKPLLEELMKNVVFYTVFNKITKEVTEEI